ncbi:family 43 glycosylhydrolase [Novosphingobium flavum]|uniref:Family 43 glycosylhydrolase n=1 Tax=Novosphingobium aerophilum TaxID=2839843 RepID=A0A7X1KBT7_9SPHN|nr:family 43 glycosylhydrolase [Novosphingobium aerophilum]MBC2651621.1 family 43 glycosylhydrolase [Novosphingobium aerophilum]MBC2661467.1 family 43 glycosylhydrolase [Novosphingobium aerophilum]
MESRRNAIKLGLTAPLAVSASIGRAASGPGVPGVQAPAATPAPAEPAWPRGIEGQRKADLGDGRYLNPVLAGDYADPSVLKDGDDYYMTHSSFDSAPGLLIWHSRDLVNWRPIGSALPRPLGTVFAVDIAKHGDRYFIYIPFMRAPWSPPLASFANIYVIHAPSMAGPWSAPIDLKIGGLIDPGHVVGEDGHRYLFFNDGKRVRLTPDGLATAGPVETVYEAWRYPDDWITEAWSPEGPKLFRRGDYFYLVNAVGGTSGPATGHMVVAARSRSIHGPWQTCPHNPIVRARSDQDLWWSRGHATCVEGADGRWFMVYHGYERGYHSLGRQTLLEPIEWDDDGWFRATGGDLSQPLAKPPGTPVPHGMPHSDPFRQEALGRLWTLYASAPQDASRVTVADGILSLTAKGDSPANCSPLTQLVGDRAYEVQVEVELVGATQGGLLLFFDDRLFLGMGIDGQRMITYRGGKAAYWQEPAPATRRLFLRITNDRQIVTFHYSTDGQAWTRHAVRAYVAGYNANTIDDLLSLRPALFAAGSGKVLFRDFRYRAL